MKKHKKREKCTTGTRTEADYEDRGFGFPVLLRKVAIATIDGEDVPLIDYDVLEQALIEYLPHIETRLTGNHVRFIRQHFQMTLRAFGERFGVAHPCVIKWEKKGDKATGMAWSTEKDMRLFVLFKLGKPAKRFAGLYEDLAEKRPVAREPRPLSVKGARVRRVSLAPT